MRSQIGVRIAPTLNRRIVGEGQQYGMSSEASLQDYNDIYKVMAFVFGKARKVSSLEVPTHSPGPGEYLQTQEQQDEGFAPFNSASFKMSAFDVEPSKTGPGCYNPKYHKQIQQDKQHRKTSSFCSKVQRFKTQQPYQPHHKTQKMMRVSLAEQPQPRKYSPSQHGTSKKESYSTAMDKSKEKMAALQSQNKRRKTDSIGTSREFVRVLLSNPNNTEIMHSVFIQKSIRKKEKGPGSYNIQSSSEVCRKRSGKVVDWSKSTDNRFKQKKDHNPGPGAYQVNHSIKKHQSCMSSSFAYQGLRSHMDELVYKTKMPFKVKVIEEKGLKDRYPGPGYYNPHRVSSKSFHYGEGSFGSYSYNNQEEPQSEAPGPGHYAFKEKADLKQELKKTRQKLFGKPKIKAQKIDNLCEKNKEEVRNQCLLQIQRTANKFYSLKERCSSKNGNFSYAQRFAQKHNHQGSPGPGQYKAAPISQEFTAFHPGFNSTSYDRCSFIKSAQNMSFYDLSRNDIGKVATRIKNNIDNLKLIQIDKAPFNCREQRFKGEQVQSNREEEEHPQMVSWNNQAQEYKQARCQLMKKNAEEHAQPSAAFKSTSKRSWGVTNPDLGPGNYYNPSSFQKKSFNQDYNYKTPLKIRPTYRTRSSMA